MSWLRAYERDPEICARAGDAALAPPIGSRALELFREHLALPGLEPPSGASLDFARWKPRVSITCGYTVSFPDGPSIQVTLKRYSDAKALAIAETFRPDRRALMHESRLRSFAALPDGRTCLYAFPTDRVLIGAARLLHLRRTARLLNELPLAPGWRARGRECSASLLRFKPERRAVFRLDLVLSDAHGSQRRTSLAVRVLPPDEAAAVVRHRRASVERAPEPFTPRLVADQERAGLLFEEWLDVDVPPPRSFEHAPQAGGLLARLHALPLQEPSPPSVPVLTEILPLLEADPRLAQLSQRLRPPRPLPACAWIHGDLHPDQVARERSEGRPRLLDLDSLAPGNPAADLATWVADRLSVDGALDFDGACRPLLAGYAEAGGELPAHGDLASRTSFELVRLAAAGIRRLEDGAVDRACGLVERSLDVLASSRVRS